MREILNLSNLLGTLAFLFIIALFAAFESGMYALSTILLILVFVCIYFSRSEDGEHNESNRGRRL